MTTMLAITVWAFGIFGVGLWIGGWRPKLRRGRW